MTINLGGKTIGTLTKILDDGGGLLLEFDALISQQHVASAVVTDSPVETGALISDHVILKPQEVTVNGIISATYLDGGEDLGQIDYAYETLMLIRSKRMPVTVSTPLFDYEMMVMDSLNVPRNAQTGGAFEFAAHFRQVTWAVTKVVNVKIQKRSGGTKTTKPMPEVVSTPQVPQSPLKQAQVAAAPSLNQLTTWLGKK